MIVAGALRRAGRAGARAGQAAVCQAIEAASSR
eukprot:COSAG01_NODE_1177_length_11372_cov_4.507851_6_plen_33_part_00